MTQAVHNLAPAAPPDNDPLPTQREIQAARMLLRLTDKHGSRAKHMAEALGYLCDERPGLEGIEDLAIALADHVVALARGVEDVRSVLQGSATA
jgi:hypothetical protein